MSHLFKPFHLRGVTLRNRIVVSPMCMYSSRDGRAGEWHLVHAATRAIGGAGAFMVEATAVEPEGRISPQDMGLWDDTHTGSLKPIAAISERQGCVPGIQLAHAGRKASCRVPWEGGGQLPLDEGGWHTIAPSPLPFSTGQRAPREMDEVDIERVRGSFASAARRACEAGFRILEIHMAHGYLLHSFLSPLSNKRRDRYGGPFENRIRFPLEVIDAVRGNWPEALPLWVRLNCRDWSNGGWDLEQAIRFSRLLKDAGVDLVDCSSGFLLPDEPVEFAPGFQVHLASAIRREAGVPTAAVGLITDSHQAETIIRSGQADLVCLGRQLLREPYWPLRAAHELGQKVEWPRPYRRAAY